MGAYEKGNRVPQSILEQIVYKTFRKLKDKEDFDSELILNLQKLNSEGNLTNEKLLISILKGESP